MSFTKLECNGNNYTITSKKAFMKMGVISQALVEKSFEFAYAMSFGRQGAHRDHRSGGTARRKPGEIFRDAFQGKIAECAIYEQMIREGLDVTEPTFDTWDHGVWDDEDFIINGKRVSVKSTKRFGNLVLLEKADYASDGTYIPNINKEGHGSYDAVILVRMDPLVEEILRQNRLLYSYEVDKELLSSLIYSRQWSFDIPGYITREDFVNIINSGFVIPKHATLNGRTVIDANNYYIQVGDMREISTFN